MTQDLEPQPYNTVVITSALSIARELWRYVEPELADRALRLAPTEVLDIGTRTGTLLFSDEAAAIWPNGPRDAALLLAAIEYLEGSARPAARIRRLPERLLPTEMQATLDELFESAMKVSRLMHQDLRP